MTGNGYCLSHGSIQHLRQFTPEKLREFINSFDIIISDCDGVVWLMLGPIPRAGEAYQLLIDRGKQVKFLSNNSVRTDQDYVSKLRKYGIKNVQENDIIHPAKTIAWYLKKHKPDCTVYPLVSKHGLDVLAENGIKTVPVNIDTFNLDCVSFTQYMQNNDPQQVHAVLADISTFVSFTHIAKALQYLKNENCNLILGAMDKVVALTENLHIPGFVDFYDILLKHSNKEPIILGKPSTLLGDIIKDHFGITNPQRCLFIGDSLDLDISFAKSCGYQSLLVLTGNSSMEDMLNASEGLKPDYYTETVADFIDLLKNI